MGLVTPAPVSIPFAHWNVLSSVIGQPLVGATEHTPGITVICGIDCSNPQFDEGANFSVQLAASGPGSSQTIVFQGFVYASSQAFFSWRGELPLFTGQELTGSAYVGTWDVVVWGVVIPNATITP